MSVGSCKLNNRYMRTIRRDEVYQALLIDLTMLGIVEKEECEMLLGCSIPASINLPNNTRGVLDEKADDTDTGDTDTGDTDTGDTDTGDTDTGDTDTDGIDGIDDDQGIDTIYSDEDN